ncbi:hypothetical protein DFH09DRAFT_1282646 [Mycena vulgaris]|nr:hypothetical protein DFH09DRAFT_1282646 [Mycena vulgaris]
MSARISTRCGRVRCHKKKKNLRTMTVMSDEDWDAIKLVLEWLVLPKGAMVKTSTTKKPMLSQTHAIFRTLQSAVKSIPSNRPPSDGRAVHRPVPSSLVKEPPLPHRRRTVNWTAVFGTVRRPGRTVTIPTRAAPKRPKKHSEKNGGNLSYKLS